MYSYKEYYDCLTTEETKDIVDVDLSLTYYCPVHKKGNICYICTEYGTIHINIGNDIKSVIRDDTGKIDFYNIFTADYITCRLDGYYYYGLAAVKIMPDALVLKTKTPGQYLATHLQICSIDLEFDKKIYLIETFGREAIKHSSYCLGLAKKVTDETIRYALRKNSKILDSITPDEELHRRILNIKAKYKL